MNAPAPPAHTTPRLNSLSHGGGGCNGFGARPDGVRLQVV